ncbi:FeoC-like transcriptional regulator [Thiocapsa bogorovii]|jgi:DeoR/GlpR family transcriptional regulator of sugar metabolism|uniref:FeoC-like transcriptional regulator n=1 Tax=Thiocapsa bogorovii TaxID=521689 RepID=UPI001E45F26B|nr:FeoC-like transcriptional regulator [Thiocapsa bogorovii]UHD17197.1 FeoC-like transcriptional regulator [Thiocapsa bogorovii]
MILSELTGYLEQHHRVGLMDLAYRFESSPDALRGMLSILERKGRVRRITGSAGCSSGCSKCDPATIETYEWIGEGAHAAEG